MSRFCVLPVIERSALFRRERVPDVSPLEPFSAYPGIRDDAGRGQLKPPDRGQTNKTTETTLGNDAHETDLYFLRGQLADTADDEQSA